MPGAFPTFLCTHKCSIILLNYKIVIVNLKNSVNNKRKFKDEAYASVASLVKALANPRRLEVIDLLANGEKRVEQIARQTNMSVANASQHLQVLKKVRLIEVRQEGTSMYYSLTSDDVTALWQMLLRLSYVYVPHLKELINQQRKGIPILSQVADFSQFILLDVRSESEFAHRHLPGAINIPLSQLPEKLDELPSDKPILAYCRGPLCTYADEAVRILRKHGFEAYRWIQPQ